jgi:hypothetical protein
MTRYVKAADWVDDSADVSQERTDEQKEKVEQRLVKRQEKTKEKLKAAGIDYDFDGVSWVSIDSW